MGGTIYPNSGLRNHLCEEVPRQKAAESRKIPESGSVIPREGVESWFLDSYYLEKEIARVIPREGVERNVKALPAVPLAPAA